MDEPAELQRIAGRWDVVVIGAGPAGSMAAISLAGRGARVLLLERAAFPREKVCGCCLNEAALESLRECGVLDAVRKAAARPVTGMTVFVRGEKARFATRPGLVLSRGVLDSLLARRAAEAGAVFADRASATVSGCGEVRVQRGAGEIDVEANAVVCADGIAGSALRDMKGFARQVSRKSFIGVGTRVDGGGGLERGEVKMGVGRAGYVGFARLEDGSVDVAAAIDPARVREAGGVAGAVREILEESGLREDLVEGACGWRGTGLLTSAPAAREAPGVFVVGDAAGYVEPFTGEGISWALRGGALVAAHVEAHLAGRYEAGNWSRAYREEFAVRQGVCRVVCGAVRRRWLLEGVVRCAAAAPGAAEWIAKRVGAPWERAGLQAEGMP